MARISNRDRAVDIIEGMSKKLQGNVANLLEAIIDLQASEDLSDLEEATVSSSRRDKTDKKSKKSKAEKPAKRGRKSKKDDDDEDEAPKKRRSKKVKPEPFDGVPTLDDCYDFLSEFEGEPVAGGIRELKPEVKKLGGDPDVLTEDAETRAEKAEELGMFLAANKALAVKLKLHDEDDISELADELGIDTDKVKSKNKQIAAILVALNSEASEEDEDEEDEDEAPKKRKSKKEKPSKKSGKKSKSKKDDDDEDDEDEEDEDEDEEDDDEEDEDDDGLDDIDDIDDDE